MGYPNIALAQFIQQETTNTFEDLSECGVVGGRVQQWFGGCGCVDHCTKCFDLPHG